MTIPGSLLLNVDQIFCKAGASSSTLVPNAGGFLRFFEAGTTTPKAVYTDSSLSTAITQPVTLNANGRPTSNGSTACRVFLQPGGYKIRVSDSSNVTLYEVDDWEDVGLTYISQLGALFSAGSKDVSTTPYTWLATDYTVTFDSATNPTVCTLPDVTTWEEDVVVKNYGASAAIRVTPQAGQTIDNNLHGTGYFVLPAATGMTPVVAPTIMLRPDAGNSNWLIISSHGIELA